MKINISTSNMIIIRSFLKGPNLVSMDGRWSRVYEKLEWKKKKQVRKRREMWTCEHVFWLILFLFQLSVFLFICFAIFIHIYGIYTLKISISYTCDHQPTRDTNLFWPNFIKICILILKLLVICWLFIKYDQKYAFMKMGKLKLLNDNDNFMWK